MVWCICPGPLLIIHGRATVMGCRPRRIIGCILADIIRDQATDTCPVARGRCDAQFSGRTTEAAWPLGKKCGMNLLAGKTVR